MEKYLILQGHIIKQKAIIEKLHFEITDIDLQKWEFKYVFALKTQQLYTAMEDLMRSVALTFENSIEDYSKYHFELVKVLTINIQNVRPELLSNQSFLILDKLRSFRHFIRHGYNYELDKDELQLLQNKIKSNFHAVFNDIETFSAFLKTMIENK
jgi:hypothetical protein